MTDWSVNVHITDHGQWSPENPEAAAHLVSVVNEHRLVDDPKPRVELWGGERTLCAHINGEFVAVAPGEHLIKARFPRAVEHWSAMPSSDLDAFRPKEPA